MALSPYLHQWALLFLPYQNLAYFRTYFDFFTQLTLYRSVTAKRKVYLVYLLYTIYSVQHFSLWWFRPPPMERFRQGDIVSVVSQEDSFYLIQIGLVPMTLYFIDVCSFTMKPAFLRVLEDTVFVDRNQALKGTGYGTVSEQTTARFIYLSLVNLLHVFVLFVDAILLSGLFKLITAGIESPGELFGSPLQTPFTFTWIIFRMIISTWMTLTVMSSFGKILVNVGALGASFVCILFRRLFHSEAILAPYKQKNGFFSWAPFQQYLAYCGKTFGLVFTMNHTGGRLFFAFLVFNMPLSAWAIVQLALGELSQRSSLVFSFFAAHELIGCILFHWTMAKLTKQLHAPSKTLLTLNAATGHRMGNFRARLILHHTIVRLHTESKYGFTYGSVGGLISMGSFGKCMLLYMELLMYAYTLIRGI